MSANPVRPHAASPPIVLEPAVLLGVRAALPLLTALGPLGVALGAAMSSVAVPALTSWLTAPLIYGASVQLAAITLLGAGSGAATVLLTVAIINARSLIYSAGLRAEFRDQPVWFRLGAPYLLVDPLFAVTAGRPAEARGARETRLFYLGAGLTIWSTWLLFVAAGILAGPALPAGLALQFAAVAMLIAMLVPGLRCRSAVVAASLGAALALLAKDLPGSSGLLVAALGASIVTSLFSWRRC